MTNENNTIVFIGGGNMARSLIGGLRQQYYPTHAIYVIDHHKETLAALKTDFDVQTFLSVTDAPKKIDILVFATKPQSITAALTEWRKVILQTNPLIVSVAAGTTVQYFQDHLSAEQAIIRVMPNTPALVGAGATGLYANANVTDTQRNAAENLLRTVGVCCWFKTEDELDIVTALSGSGPAYFLLLMESLCDAAIKQGLPADEARTLILQTCLGTAKLAQESGTDLTVLRKRVTSPGGTTEQGIAALLKGQLPKLAENAIIAATKRAKELAHE